MAGFRTDHRGLGLGAALLAALALGVLAGCAGHPNRALVSSRRVVADPPLFRTLVVTVDSPGLFRAYEHHPRYRIDDSGATRDTTFFFPQCLGQSLLDRLDDHHVTAACVFTGFSDTGPAVVDSLADALGAEAFLHISCPYVSGEFSTTLASLMGRDPTAFGEVPRLLLSDLDLELSMPSTARPDRNLWTSYMQVERGSGGLAAYADSIAAVIERRLVSDGMVPGASAGKTSHGPGES